MVLEGGLIPLSSLFFFTGGMGSLIDLFYIFSWENNRTSKPTIGVIRRAWKADGFPRIRIIGCIPTSARLKHAYIQPRCIQRSRARFRVPHSFSCFRHGLRYRYLLPYTYTGDDRFWSALCARSLCFFFDGTAVSLGIYMYYVMRNGECTIG